MAPEEQMSREERRAGRQRALRMWSERPHVPKEVLYWSMSNTPRPQRFNQNRLRNFEQYMNSAKPPITDTAVTPKSTAKVVGDGILLQEPYHENRLITDNNGLDGEVVRESRHTRGPLGSTCTVASTAGPLARDPTTDLRRIVGRKATPKTYSKHNQPRFFSKQAGSHLPKESVVTKTESYHHLRLEARRRHRTHEQTAHKAYTSEEDIRPYNNTPSLHPSSPSSPESLTIEESLSLDRRAQQAANVDYNTRITSSIHNDTSSHITVDQGEELREPNASAQEEDLDDLELEILGLSQQSSALTSPFLRSPKRPRSFSINDSPDPDLYGIQYQIEDADDESDNESEEPSPKKQRRASRKCAKAEANTALRELRGRRELETGRKASGSRADNFDKHKKTKSKKLQRKSPRRLPVNELVEASDRLKEPDSDIRDKRAELPQDPISQSSLSEQDSGIEIANRQRIKTRIQIEFRQRRDFGVIDIKQFRLPRGRQISPNSGHHQQCAAPWSDGFEGKERNSIGRVMPVKQPSRRERLVHRVAFPVNELTIVADREFEEVAAHEDEQRRASPQSRKKRGLVQMPAQEGVQTDDGDDASIYQQGVPISENGNGGLPLDEAFSVVLGPQTLKIVPSDNSILGSATATSSPLKREVMWVGKLPQDSGPPASQRTPFKPNDEFVPSQHLKMVSAMGNAPRRNNREELEISQQLSMVSIRKRAAGIRERNEDSKSDSEEQSGEGSFSDQESEEDDSSEQEEDEGDDTQQGASDPESEERKDHRARSQNTGDELEQQTGRVEDSTMHLDLEQSPQHMAILHQIQLPKPNSKLSNAMHPQSASQLPPKATLVIHAARKRLDPESVITTRQKLYAKEATKSHSGVRSREQNQNGHDSWRPQKPDQCLVAMEVEDNFDSPTHLPPQTRKPSARDQTNKRGTSRPGSRPLTIAQSQSYITVPEDPQANFCNSQGSVILGDSQRLIRHSRSSTILEIQLDSEAEQPEIPESQLSYDPKESYFERASHSLRLSVKRLNFHRTKSIPAGLHLSSLAPNMKAGGSTLSGVLEHTISPNKKGIGLLPSMLERQSERKVLTELTKQASIGFGTIPGSTRRRMVSLPFTPPFMLK